MFISLALGACSSPSELAKFSSPDALRSAIVNGEPLPQATSLTPDQVLAVVYLADIYGDPFCSGTLIADRLIATARHCVPDARPEDVWVGFGPKASFDAAVLPVAQIHLHESLDFALLYLGQSAQAQLGSVTPIELNRQPLDETWVGRIVDAVGYGLTLDATRQGRFFAQLPSSGIYDTTVSVDGQGERGLCFGDSGGPIIWQPSADDEPVVLGMEQWGDPSCVGVDYLTRADLVAEWVDARLDVYPMPDELERCTESRVTATVCEHEQATRCDGRFIRVDDCAAKGTRCTYLGPREGMGCLPSSCEDYDYWGSCEGAAVVFCQDGEVRSLECGDRGQQCGWVDEVQGNACLDCTTCDGECVDFGSSLEHCGGCGQVCGVENGATECLSGFCAFRGCEEGYEDADGDLSNGCERAIPTQVTTISDTDSGCTQTGSQSLWTFFFVLFLSRIFVFQRSIAPCKK